ncbi:MAG: Spy/CpxP family protein refolding chaperone, partial [Candidatus Eisenbacteria bacterium]|nr:Spy/CpxP family protein refolding chaperone [Candidatus Eisenbacteria bacterium]
MRRMPTRMVSRIGLFALLSLGLGGLGQTALAQHAGCPMGGAARGAKAPGDGEGKAALRGARGDDLGLRGARMLDLSEQQVEAIRKLRDEGRKAGTALQKEMLRLRHELRGEMIKDEPALARAQELTRRIGELRTQFQEKRLEQRLAARKVLTAEQRDRLLLQRSEGGRR